MPSAPRRNSPRPQRDQPALHSALECRHGPLSRALLGDGHTGSFRAGGSHRSRLPVAASGLTPVPGAKHRKRRIDRSGRFRSPVPAAAVCEAGAECPWSRRETPSCPHLDRASRVGPRHRPGEPDHGNESSPSAGRKYAWNLIGNRGFCCCERSHRFKSDRFVANGLPCHTRWPTGVTIGLPCTQAPRWGCGVGSVMGELHIDSRPCSYEPDNRPDGRR